MHDEAPPEEGDDEDKEDADEESEASGEADEEERGVLQVMAGDLSRIQIWQKNSHEDASKDHKFDFSRRIRLSIMQALRRYGARATSMNKDIVAMISKPRGQSAETFPQHRILTTTQVKGMMSAQRNRTRLHFNPFRATHLMPHDFNKDDSKSKFTVAITDNFSLDSTIANTAGPNSGIFMDTTHRLQNENRVATTVLCTANQNLHMTPRAYLTAVFKQVYPFDRVVLLHFCLPVFAAAFSADLGSQFRRKCGASELMDSIAEAAESLAEHAAVNMPGWLRATIEKSLLERRRSHRTRSGYNGILIGNTVSEMRDSPYRTSNASPTTRATKKAIPDNTKKLEMNWKPA
ncbi:hypothetical protein C8J57DRAFT_1239548 [Mycena rebaudengoi]|nr:hypothetical protein C8J57DRAFT_1239548 [Mycena rebaudengoi]